LFIDWLSLCNHGEVKRREELKYEFY